MPLVTVAKRINPRTSAGVFWEFVSNVDLSIALKGTAH